METGKAGRRVVAVVVMTGGRRVEVVDCREREGLKECSRDVDVAAVEAGE